MGMTYLDATMRGPTGKLERMTFLLDSGSQYTLLPHNVWTALELRPKRTQSFRLVDGTSTERFALSHGDIHTPVILGEPGDDQPLLGIVALEELGLQLNPLNRELEPMNILL
jgi:predicted aspartyl protease